MVSMFNSPVGRTFAALVAAFAVTSACNAQTDEEVVDAVDGVVDAIVDVATADEGFEAVGVPSGAYVEEATHAYITFSYNHLGFSNPTIAFGAFDAELDFDAENPAASSLQVTIDADSIDTGVEGDFEQHIRDTGLFDVANHPLIEFQSTSVERTGESTGLVTGDLTIRGVTVPVMLDVVLNGAGAHPMSGVTTLGFGASATVSRSDWGMTYAVPAVSDEVHISIEAEFQPAGG